MNVWLVQIGEPVPLEAISQERLLRTGILANMLVERNHSVTWWASTFDRVRRVNIFNKNTTIYPRDGLSIKLLHATGYKKSLSIDRIRYHRKISKIFSSAILNEAKPDLILCSYPTIELCKESVDYGIQNNVPVIIDIRDMWPDIIVDAFPRFIRPLARLCLSSMFRTAYFACSRATAITSITDEFVDWGVNKAKRQRSPWDRCFYHGYRSNKPQIEQLREAETFWDNFGIRSAPDCFTICFVGTFGHQYDIATIIEAARKLQLLEKEFSVKFVMCGSGDMLNHYKKLACNIEAVVFPGWLNSAQIYVLLRRSHIGLNLIPDRYDYLATINNKAIEYLSAGLPIVMSPQKGVLYDLISEHNCGIGFEKGNSEDLTDKLYKIFLQSDNRISMSKNAQNVFLDKFTAEKVYGDMVNYLEDFLRERNNVCTKLAFFSNQPT